MYSLDSCSVDKIGTDSFRLISLSAQCVLNCVVCFQVLLVSDDAEVRQLVRSGDWVKDRLAVVTATHSMKQLVNAFKVKHLQEYSET